MPAIRRHLQSSLERVVHLRVILFITAALIAVITLVVSHLLVKDLAREELKKTEMWAEAMRALNTADENTDISLVFKIIQDNTTIPIIVTDEKGTPTQCRNINTKGRTSDDSISIIKETANQLHKDGKYIRIDLKNGYYSDVCYDESLMLKRLEAYPYIVFGAVLIFLFVSLFALYTSRKALQNKLWVGLSKETAHQLGTPISSLLGWTEILKDSYPDDELLPEMQKDVERLQLIAERFSKIGSYPEPVPEDLGEAVTHVAQYMDRRTSSKVKISCQLPPSPLLVPISSQLFEWVIENLCKNAVDAMEGSGAINIRVMQEGTKAVIEVSDTGKGISRKDFKKVFMPGFSTKKRGWGLGLSLAKRVIEEYHNGRIFVKDSQIGVGTTFRIELR
ncbi:MAG: ATP-binding protein [Bacteroidaceae bacterium]|nr:ATP-binding protein [Bacteroidaceae bacterium]